MKKLLMVGMLMLVVAAFVSPQALAADDEGKTKFTGELRSRFEYVENYLDATSDKNWDGGDAVSFWPYRVRLGIEHEFGDSVRVFGEIQNAGHFGRPDWSEYGTPTSLFNYYDGLGPYYLQPMHGMDWYPWVTSLEEPAFHGNAYEGAFWGTGRGTLLYQAYAELGKLGVDSLSLRVGRQEHTLGTQLLMGNNEFYNGISFDGARLMWKPEKFGVEAFYYKLNESYAASTDANFFGVTGTYKISDTLGSIDGYVLQYQNLDDTDLVFTPSWLAWANLDLTTLGARWGRMVKSADDMKAGAFDWNAEIALQSGDAPTYVGDNGQYDFSGTIFEGWFGWNFATGSGRSRVHVGTLMASGQKYDEDYAENGDLKYKGFIPLFGNNWAANRLGDLDMFDMTDIFDINLGYAFMTANDKHKFGVMFHMLDLAEDVAIYDPEAEDYQLLSSLGTELDLRYTWKLNDKTSVSGGYAYLMPGDVFDAAIDDYTYGNEALPHLTSADSVSRLWAQLRVRW